MEDSFNQNKYEEINLINIKDDNYDSAPIIETNIPREEEDNKQNLEDPLIQTNIPPPGNNSQRFDNYLIQNNIPQKQNTKENENKNSLNKYINYMPSNHHKQNKNSNNLNDDNVKFQQKSITLYNERKETEKKIKKEELERKETVFRVLFGILFLNLLLTIADIIIQFKNNIGKNILLIDDSIYIVSLLLIIINLIWNKYYYYYIVYHCLSLVSYIINDSIFFIKYIEKYKSIKPIFNFFISYCIIKFVLSFMITYLYLGYFDPNFFRVDI